MKSINLPFKLYFPYSATEFSLYITFLVEEKFIFGRHRFRYFFSIVSSHKLAVIITSGSSICNSLSKKFVFSKSESSKKR